MSGNGVAFHLSVSRKRVIAGAVSLMACAQYFVAEAVAAAAWRDPTYSYAQNYISDLGALHCARTEAENACSPLAAVMNGGFVLAGVLCLIAAWLLTPLVRPGVWRWVVAALAIAHGLGSIGVGLAPSTPGLGTPTPHLLAAYAAILGGNTMLVAAGFAGRGAGAPRWYGAASVGLGVLGLAAGATLVGSRGWPPGLLERMAVDPITVWEVMTGFAIAAWARGRSREPAQPGIR